ncbi:MAG TPA: site-specific integrase [Stellaceae bacterium]|jgi:integrase|nr:site-specific integrase [Stellaceae bacterium]
MSLTLYQRPGSRIWYVRGVAGAKRHGQRRQPINESTGLTDYEQAKIYAAQRETELFEASIVGTRAGVRFREAALSYLHFEPRSPRTHDYVKRLIRHFGTRLIGTIDQDAADAAVKAIVGADAAPATKVRGVLVPLIAVMTYGEQRKWCERPRFQKPSIPDSPTRWLAPSEAKTLIAAAAPHLKPLLIFLLGTGARLSEALDLIWGDVELGRARAIFQKTKNGARRVAGLPPAAVAALANLPHREGAVFRRDDGAPYTDRKRLEGGQIKTAFHAACRRAGLVEWGEVVSPPLAADGPYTPVGWRWSLTPHDLRHTWATWIYALQPDILRLKQEGGWRRAEMVERYAHLMPPELTAGIAEIWGGQHPAIVELSVQAKPGIADRDVASIA